ncbi:hypothetical protein PPERSA_00257 [Pseudocohnilembus persalinus]|uniref:Uncharacterized protein n=1 Tax=Pseudocohnilembus persalinus TaxID=266149 RepID=A0A0V0Q8W0_PSEPJ|nr:hypothetical protein PPERSA_00257 [Pseudocohnilembus persalinus]|eukprot:KRW98669.1 hypothetical protein PPERSA_00257 [Pseudocohnilembus persalinus]
MEEKNEEQKSSQNIGQDKQLEKQIEQKKQEDQIQSDDQNEENIEIKDKKQSEEKDEDLGITFIKGPVGHPHEPKPAFFVGIIEDGREDKDNFSEQKGVYKKIFGSNNQKFPDNKGMMSNIEGVYEYNYDIEQDLTPDSDTVMSVVLDFDKNVFRILTPAKKNIHQSLKKFLNLNERDWRVYFGWLECSSSVTILEVRRTETKIKPKDKYGREIDI